MRKGEHGLTIWIPLGAKAEAAGESGGEAGEGRRFGTASVFDVGQTVELTEESEDAAPAEAVEIPAAGITSTQARWASSGLTRSQLVDLTIDGDGEQDTAPRFNIGQSADAP